MFDRARPVTAEEVLEEVRNASADAGKGPVEEPLANEILDGGPYFLARISGVDLGKLRLQSLVDRVFGVDQYGDS